MTELEDLVLGIIASHGCLSFAEIVNALSFSGYSDEGQAQEALSQLVAEDLLVLIPKQEKLIPPAHGRSGDIRPGTVIHIIPEKYCIQKAPKAPVH